MSEPSFSSLLKQRSFVQFWLTALASTLASQMLMVAVGWQMYELTGSAWDFRLVGLYQFVLALLLTLVAGHVADRVNRARIVSACLAIQLVVAMLLCAASFESALPVGSRHSGWLSRDFLPGVSVTLDLFAMQLGCATALLPMFAKDIWHVGAWGLGMLRSAPAVSALLMSILLTRWPVSRKVGPKLMIAGLVFGAATVVFGLSTSFVLSFAALVFTGAADMVSVVIRQTLVQRETRN